MYPGAAGAAPGIVFYLDYCWAAVPFTVCQ